MQLRSDKRSRHFASPSLASELHHVGCIRQHGPSSPEIYTIEFCDIYIYIRGPPALSSRTFELLPLPSCTMFLLLLRPPPPLPPPPPPHPPPPPPPPPPAPPPPPPTPPPPPPRPPAPCRPCWSPNTAPAQARPPAPAQPAFTFCVLDHKQSPCKPQTISVKVSETSFFRRKRMSFRSPGLRSWLNCTLES